MNVIKFGFYLQNLVKCPQIVNAQSTFLRESMPRSLRVIIQNSLQSINGSFWCQWHRPRFSKSSLWKHLWVLHRSDLGLQFSKQVLDLSLIFVLELSVSHSGRAVRCVPIPRQGWGVLFCSNGRVTPLEIMVIILWLTLTLPDYILMTVQLIHFYCLCLGMEFLECAANALEIKSVRGPVGWSVPSCILCSYSKEAVKSKGI